MSQGQGSGFAVGGFVFLGFRWVRVSWFLVVLVGSCFLVFGGDLWFRVFWFWVRVSWFFGGNAWKCKEMQGNAWKCMEMHETVRKCMEMDANAWKCMEMHMHGNAWKCLDIFGNA